MKNNSLLIILFSLTIIIGLGGFCLLAFHPVQAYEIPFETNGKNYCVLYSCMLVDEIGQENASVVMFQSEGVNQYHAMVLVNHKQPDCYLIESYTGEEYRTKQKLTEHLHKYRVVNIFRTPPYQFAFEMVDTFAALNR